MSVMLRGVESRAEGVAGTDGMCLIRVSTNQRDAGVRVSNKKVGVLMSKKILFIAKLSPSSM